MAFSMSLMRIWLSYHQCHGEEDDGGLEDGVCSDDELISRAAGDARLFNFIKEALMSVEPHHTEYAASQEHLRDLYCGLFDTRRGPTGLGTLLSYDTQAMNVDPDSHVGLPPESMLRKLREVVALCEQRFCEHRNPGDLDAALYLKKSLVEITPPNHPNQAIYQGDLAWSYMHRFQRWNHTPDLDAALHLRKAALASTPAHDPALAARQTSLAFAYNTRYKHLGHLADLDAAVHYDAAAEANTPAGHPDLASRQSCLASSYHDRYKRLGSPADLKAAIVFDSAAVAGTPAGHPDLPHRYECMAASHYDQYVRVGRRRDLETALRAARAAVEGTVPPAEGGDAASLADRQLILATCYIARYNDGDGWELEDLEAALWMDMAAVENTPPGHPEHAARRDNLVVSYLEPFERLRGADKQSAVFQMGSEEGEGEALGRAGPDVACYLGILSRCYARRSSQQCKSQGDLDSAIRLGKASVARTPLGHPELPGRLGYLVGLYLDRFDRHDGLGDLVGALPFADALVESGDGARSSTLGDRQEILAAWYGARYRRKGKVEDLDAALLLDKMATENMPLDEPYLGSRQENMTSLIDGRNPFTIWHIGWA